MRNECERCEVAEACRHAFGKYWGERSHGGVGCEEKFPAAAGAERSAAVGTGRTGAEKAAAVQLKFWQEEA